MYSLKYKIKFSLSIYIFFLKNGSELLSNVCLCHTNIHRLWQKHTNIQILYTTQNTPTRSRVLPPLFLSFHTTIRLSLYLDSVRMTRGRGGEMGVRVYRPDIGWSEE